MTIPTFVKAPREPYVVKQAPSVNPHKNHPLIDQKCCYRVVEIRLDGIFCLQWHIDYTIAITPESPTEEPVNSLIMENEHLDTIPATESDEFIKSSVEILVPIPSESKGVPKILLELMKIPSASKMSSMFEAITSQCLSQLSSKSLVVAVPLLLQIYHLQNYKAFYIDNDHFKEKSSGSTTTHVDFSQYDSFIFDLSNDQFPPTDRSDFYHEEFADELAHIISPPEYDRFCLRFEPSCHSYMECGGKYFPIKRTESSRALYILPTFELYFIPSSESIFAYRCMDLSLHFLFIPLSHLYLLLLWG
ncbi:hypothetical protein Tco_0273206 [Tanacetum coccineum]